MPSADDSLPPGGRSLEQAFEALVATLNDRGIRYAIIGGIALIQHTRVRTTNDIDALLAVPQVQMAPLFEALADRGFSVDVERATRDFSDSGFVSLRYGDVVVDLLQPLIPAFARVLDRAVQTQILGHPVRIGSAEGLIITKLMAMRPQDESDIRDLLAAYAGRLDLDFVRAEMDTFTDADDPRRAKFEAWVGETSPGQ